MVPDPHADRRVDVEREDHACADAEDGATDPHERGVRAEGRDQAAGNDGGDGDADEVRDASNPRLFGRDAFDGLEVEGEIVDVGVKGAGDEAVENSTRAHASLAAQDSGWHRCEVLQVELKTGEDDDEQSEPEQTAPHSTVGPRIDGAAPLQC